MRQVPQAEDWERRPRRDFRLSFSAFRFFVSTPAYLCRPFFSLREAIHIYRYTHNPYITPQ